MPKPKEFKVAPEPTNDITIDEVIAIMDRWFWDLEDGKTQNRFPSPHGLQVTMDEADTVIAYIDKEIEYEVNTHTSYFKEQRNMDIPADFNRLNGISRITFVQEVLQAKERLELPRGQKPRHPGHYWVP